MSRVAKKKTLVLFDLDDTLVITDTKIQLRDPLTNEVIDRVSTSQFRDLKNSMDKKSPPIFDFSEFTNIDKVVESFHRASQGPALGILQRTMDDPNAEVGILTIRSSETAVTQGLPLALFKWGVSRVIDPDLIFAVNDPRYNELFRGKSGAERKLQVILKILNDQVFDSIILIDDDPEYKEVINAYCDQHNIHNVRVILVG